MLHTSPRMPASGALALVDEIDKICQPASRSANQLQGVGSPITHASGSVSRECNFEGKVGSPITHGVGSPITHGEMHALLNLLELRLIQSMEGLLEKSFAKHSKILQPGGDSELPPKELPPKVGGQSQVPEATPGANNEASTKQEAPEAVARESSKQEVFKKLDTSQDGKISREEWVAGVEAEKLAGPLGGRRILAAGHEGLETKDEVFDRLDTDHDGVVTQEEWDAGLKAEEAAAGKTGKRKFLFARHKKEPHLGHQVEADDIFQVMAQSLLFQVSVIIVIVLQSGHLGWEANERLNLETERLEGGNSNVDLDSHFRIVSIVFTCFFTIEILIRLVAWRSKFFSLSDQEFFFWNAFDLFMVVGALLELINIKINSLRAVRLLRVARVLRILRVAPKLRKMVYALMHSMQALFWLMIMLSVTLYIFALAFMQGSIEYLETKSAQEYQADRASAVELTDTLVVVEKFGTLSAAMKSLFAAITGGDPWDWLFTPLMDYSWMYTLIALFFVVFFVFAVMNVVTGVFVDEAMKISQIDKDIMISDIRAEDKLLENDMRQLVQSLDQDGDGDIGVEELKEMLAKDEVQRWLQGCDIDLTLENLEQIFGILDHQHTGRVNPEDFFGMLSKIKGQARSIDIFLMYHEVQDQAAELRSFMAAHWKAQQAQQVKQP